MSTTRKSYGLLAIFTATAASLCCIAPLLAVVAGAGGLASNFSWLEPWRPFLIGFTLLVLAVAWYQKLKPRKQDDCECEPRKTPFLQKKSFLGVITVASALMLAFPYYSDNFHPANAVPTVASVQNQLQTAEFGIEGMTCSGCENHIKLAVNELSGIHSVTASYQNEKAIVVFDQSKTKQEEIISAILSTGYTIKE